MIGIYPSFSLAVSGAAQAAFANSTASATIALTWSFFMGVPALLIVWLGYGLVAWPGRMRAHGLFIDIAAPSGLAREDQFAVLDHQWIGQEFTDPGSFIHHIFHHREVRNRRRHVRAHQG